MKKFAALTPELILLIIFLCIGYIPRLGAVDNIGPQWLALSIANLICGLFFFSNAKYKTLYIPFSNSVLLFLGFILWSGFSLFYAVNFNEALIKLSRWGNLFFLLVNLTLLVKHIGNWKVIISFLITIGLSWEVYKSMSGYFDVTSITNYDFSKAGFLKGVTGNKNVTAASIAFKIPFVLFLLQTSKKAIVKILLFSLLGLSLFNLVLLSSRAVYISVIVYALLYALLYLYYNYTQNANQFIKKSLANISVFIAPLITVILLSFITLGSSNSVNILNRIQTINSEDTSTQIRLRFYEHAIEQIIHNPLVGTGLGNWKLKSIAYDAQNMNGYVVPYHAHNDFLEIGAELGVIGMLIYLAFLLVPSVKLLRKQLNTKDVINFHFGIALLGALIVYGVDANLNFPHARVIMQIGLMIVIAMCGLFTVKNRSEWIE